MNQLGQVCTASQEQVRQALIDAGESPSRLARLLTAKARGDFMLAVAGELQKRADEVAKLITPLRTASRWCKARARWRCRSTICGWFAEEGRRAYGRVIPHQVAGQA